MSLIANALLLWLRMRLLAPLRDWVQRPDVLGRERCRAVRHAAGANAHRADESQPAAVIVTARLPTEHRVAAAGWAVAGRCAVAIGNPVQTAWAGSAVHAEHSQDLTFGLLSIGRIFEARSRMQIVNPGKPLELLTCRRSWTLTRPSLSVSELV